MDTEITLNGWEKTGEICNTIDTKTRPIPNKIKYIFVLAGGLKEDGSVHDFVKSRLDKAIQLYNDYKKINIDSVIIVMGGGTYHKPPILNKEKYVIHESSSCASYLHKAGIPAQYIYREWSSYDTIANGYYAFLTYILPLNICNCRLITSEFHIERASTIFDYFNKIIYDNKLSIIYIQTSNTNLPQNILCEREKREKTSNENFKQNIVKNINTLYDFTTWFYSEHGAYKSIISYVINKDDINNTY